MRIFPLFGMLEAADWFSNVPVKVDFATVEGVDTAEDVDAVVVVHFRQFVRLHKLSTGAPVVDTVTAVASL